jgi:3-oxoacyl-[acyl-carrier protein] reductase
MDKTCSFEVDVTEKDVDTFAHLSGDYNPLHTDPGFAKGTEFGRPIVHGAFLIGLVSRVLGMHIPGTRSLILSLKAQFPKALYYPARVRVDGLLRQFNDERGTGSVAVTVTDLARAWQVLSSEVAFILHGTEGLLAPAAATGVQEQAQALETPERARHQVDAGAARLLMTGGTGGIGSALVRDLMAGYRIHCLTRRARLQSDSGCVRFEQVDLEEPGALEDFLARTSPSLFYGILHLSVPPIGRSFISDDLSGTARHWRHAVEIPLLLAKWARQEGSQVRRLVLLGSTAGSRHPQVHTGAYSLGKAAMEHLARLLAADLAAQGATINVVVPTLVPTGLNEGLSERARASIAGKMPTGRLLEPRDIAGVVDFLLSDKASQVNGATIFVDGGAGE